MINVEFDIYEHQKIIITIDNQGVDDLIHECSFLTNKFSHNHLFSNSWSAAACEDLTEHILSGKDFHWCHELVIVSVEDDYFHKNSTNKQLSIDVTISNHLYDALSVSVFLTHQELFTLIEQLRTLSPSNDELSLKRNTQYSQQSKIGNPSLQIEEIPNLQLQFKYYSKEQNKESIHLN